MPYTPPVGTANLNLTGSYTPPVGTVDLNLAPPGDDRSITITARTGGARAAIIAGSPIQVALTARTGGARAGMALAYDPNLLSDVTAHTEGAWQPGFRQAAGVRHRWQEADRFAPSCASRWQDGRSAVGASRNPWQVAARLSHNPRTHWQDGLAAVGASRNAWQVAARLSHAARNVWQAGLGVRASTQNHWQMPLRVVGGLTNRWQAGALLTAAWISRWQDGARLTRGWVEIWERAGYPGHPPKPGPALPLPLAPSWGSDLFICQPLPGTALKLGRVPCPTMGFWNVPIRRTYRVINSCSLVRLPDLTPLPVTAMTLETDAKSWCWALSATLAGSDAWSLVEPVGPAYLPWEVQATINGHVWQFLLDIPNRTRAFGNRRVTLSGRSRSAWLEEPYDARVFGYNANIRTANQIAEEILAGTGWTLDWQLDDWLIPAKRWERDNTQISALKRLLNPVRGLLYSDPALAILTAYPEYPTASWLWAAATPDVTIPEDALRTWTQQPDFKTPYNGVYVSGTSHGVLAFVKIAGTDGALTPGQPLVEALCCDDNGIAARMRGLAELSASGPGYTLSADLLLTEAGDPSGPGLIKPGLLITLAGLLGRVRGVRIDARWNQGLNVTQSITVERKEETA